MYQYNLIYDQGKNSSSGSVFLCRGTTSFDKTKANCSSPPLYQTHFMSTARHICFIFSNEYNSSACQMKQKLWQPPLPPKASRLQGLRVLTSLWLVSQSNWKSIFSMNSLQQIFLEISGAVSIFLNQCPKQRWAFDQVGWLIEFLCHSCPRNIHNVRDVTFEISNSKLTSGKSFVTVRKMIIFARHMNLRSMHPIMTGSNKCYAW